MRLVLLPTTSGSVSHSRGPTLMDGRATALVLALALLPVLGGSGSVRAQSNDALAPTPGEGLYDPEQVALSPAVARAAEGVVRATSVVRFHLRLFTDPDSARAARSAPGARRKTHTDRGTLWPVLVDTSAVRSLCSSRLTSAQTGFYTICRTLRRDPCRTFPCTRVTRPLEGTATGFFVGRRPDGSAVVATNYHVARETIERHNRTEGVTRPRTASAGPDLKVLVSQNGSHTAGSYRRAEGASLLMNASEAAWQSGEDWALVEVPASEVPPSARMLPLANRAPAPGDTLYAMGFPVRTVRDLPAGAPYRNAENDLRVSMGVVVRGDSAQRAKSESSDILARMDVVAGNSGSPVLNQKGRVVGIVRHHTHTRGEIDLNVGSYGGVAQIVPIRFFRDYVRRLRRQEKEFSNS